MLKITRVLSLILGFGFGGNVLAKDYQPLVSEPEAHKQIREFAKEMAAQYQFNEKVIVDKLTTMQHRQDIIERITKPAEGLPWYKYRNIFIKDKRIDDGVDFWRQHAETLARAEQEYGVDQSIIVGIIGVETFYGRIQGNFPVIEALHTLGFYYPKRAKFFRSELAHYFQLAREQSWSLDEIKGSYAGAMGMGQFISSSYRAYGVDFNGDGKINLFNDPVDMIGSVANYFKRHRWQEKGFVAKTVQLKPKQSKLVQSTLKLDNSLQSMQQAGIDTSDINSTSAGIFAFDSSPEKKEHWLVGDNFYVITRYNHSELYALAAFQLSQAIQVKYRQSQIAK